MFQNKYLKINNEHNHFGNGWGLYVDIEKIKYNFPANHEILRKKYDLQHNNCYLEICNDYCCVTKIDINMPIENKFPKTNRILNFILRIFPTLVMVSLLTYVIIFVL
jgi:hypothetical protein